MSTVLSATGAASYQPRATPHEPNHPTEQRAEGPFQFQRIANDQIGHHFRGVTKLIAQINRLPIS